MAFFNRRLGKCRGRASVEGAVVFRKGKCRKASVGRASVVRGVVSWKGKCRKGEIAFGIWPGIKRNIIGAVKEVKKISYLISCGC